MRFRKVVVVLMALSPGAACFASPELMLCLHRDGQVRVETFERSCCETEREAPPACPDEDCRDLPMLESGPVSAPDAPIVFDLCSTSFEPPADPVVVPIPASRRPRSFSGPPGPERHLLTVVLRR